MQELERRRYLLVEGNCVNIIKYNKKYPDNKMKYYVLIIDEFAFTSPRRSDDKNTKKRRQRLQSIVADLGMMSAKAGIHLIIAMQRPSKELIPMEIKSNFPCAISFKCVNFGTSMTVLGNTDAYYLPNIKGRMIFQLGSKQMELQAMLLEQEEAIERLNMFDKIDDKFNNHNKYIAGICVASLPMAKAGISFVTSAPAATIAPLPIVTPGWMITRGPINT